MLVQVAALVLRWEWKVVWIYFSLVLARELHLNGLKPNAVAIHNSSQVNYTIMGKRWKCEEG